MVRKFTINENIANGNELVIHWERMLKKGRENIDT